jgi:hemerythrin-like metal-binding protein
MSLTLIDFKTLPQLQIAALDEDHEKLVDLINSFASYVSGEKVTRKKFNQHINSIYRSSNYHFSNEEIFMREARYPDLKKHMMEHAKLKRSFWNLRIRLLKQRGKDLELVQEQLKGWLTEHIKTDDMAFSEYVIEEKLDIPILTRKMLEMIGSTNKPPVAEEAATGEKEGEEAEPVSTVPAIINRLPIAIKRKKNFVHSNFLVAMDGTPHGKRGVTMAVELARLGKDPKITGFHVNSANPTRELMSQISQNLPDPDQGKPWMEELDEYFQPILGEEPDSIVNFHLAAGEEICKKAKIPFLQCQLEGRDHLTIQEELADGKHDLFVIGAMGLGAVLEDSRNGLNIRLLRRVPIDMLVLKNAKSLKKPGPIMVAMDSSANAYGSLLTALELAISLKRPLILVMVAYDPYQHYLALEQTIGALVKEEEGKEEEEPAPPPDKDWDGSPPDGLVNYFRAHLMQAGKIAKEKNIDAERVLLSGKPAITLQKLVKKHKPSLLVLGKTGLHSEESLEMGSVTESLLKTLPCDLLISCRNHTPVFKKAKSADDEDSQQSDTEGSNNQEGSDGADGKGANSEGKEGEDSSDEADLANLEASEDEAPALEWDLEAQKLLDESQKDGQAGLVRRAIDIAAAKNNMKKVDAAFVKKLLEPPPDDDGLRNLGSMPWDKKSSDFLAPFSMELGDLIGGIVEKRMWDIGKDRVDFDDLSKLENVWKKNNDKELKTEDLEQIVRILKDTQAVDNRVRVKLPTLDTRFTTKLKPNPDSEKAEDAHILDKECLYIAPLTPDNGNAILEEKKEAELQFFHYSRNYRCNAPLLDVEGEGAQKVYKLGFPVELYDRADQRAYSRVEITKAHGLKPRVYVSISKAFLGNVRNISFGGIAFNEPKKKFKLKLGMELRFLMEPSGLVGVTVYGIIIGEYDKDGEKWYEAQFKTLSKKGSGNLQDMIAHFRNKQLV